MRGKVRTANEKPVVDRYMTTLYSVIHRSRYLSKNNKKKQPIQVGSAESRQFARNISAAAFFFWSSQAFDLGR